MMKADVFLDLSKSVDINGEFAALRFPENLEEWKATLLEVGKEEGCIEICLSSDDGSSKGGIVCIRIGKPDAQSFAFDISVEELDGLIDALVAVRKGHKM